MADEKVPGFAVPERIVTIVKLPARVRLPRSPRILVCDVNLRTGATATEAVRQVLVRVKGMAVPDPGERFWTEFPEKVRRGLARERPTGRAVWNVTWMPSWPLALAASVLLVVGAWLLRGQFVEAPAPSFQTADFTTADLPGVADADWHDYWEVDPDAALVEMARQLDRQTMDRLLAGI